MISLEYKDPESIEKLEEGGQSLGTSLQAYFHLKL